MITDNGFALLQALSTYNYLTRPQLQRICFPHHKGGRPTRKHLTKLHGHGAINRTQLLVQSNTAASGCPMYYLSRVGTELLATHFDDPAYMSANTKRPRADMLHHWFELNNSRIAINGAISAHDDIAITQWINEWDTVNKEDHRSVQFVLHTVLRESPTPLSCSPDAGFLFSYQGHKIVIYVEQDRNTSGVKQVANKAAGYAELFDRRHHKIHFPDTTVDTFFVLLITTNTGRRKLLAKALDSKPCAQLWLLVNQADLSSQNFPFGSVFVNTKGEPGPLAQKQEVAVTQS